MDRSELGRRGEDAAAVYLEGRGHHVIERNWRCVLGEIDIVSVDGQHLVFTEVKTRSGRAAGTPEEAVGAMKRRRLARLASMYLSRQGLVDVPYRVDVVAIDARGDRARLRHHRDALGGP